MFPEMFRDVTKTQKQTVRRRSKQQKKTAASVFFLVVLSAFGKLAALSSLGFRFYGKKYLYIFYLIELKKILGIGGT